MDYLDLLAKLRSERIKQSLTQFDLDEKTGFSAGVIAKYESGQRAPLSYNLYCWALALGLQLELVKVTPRQGSGHNRPEYKGADLDERSEKERNESREQGQGSTPCGGSCLPPAA